MYRSVRAALGLLVVAVLPIIATAQTGSIRGRVVDSARAEPLNESRVSLLPPAGTQIGATTTDLRGRYRFDRVATGEYRISVGAIGFPARDFPGVRVVAGGTVVDLTLGARAAVLPDLVALTPLRSPIRDAIRRQPVTATVITQREVEDRAALTIADHLKGVAGVASSEGGLVQSNIVARGFNNIFSGSLLALIERGRYRLQEAWQRIPQEVSSSTDRSGPLRNSKR